MLSLLFFSDAMDFAIEKLRHQKRTKPAKRSENPPKRPQNQPKRTENPPKTHLK